MIKRDQQTVVYTADLDDDLVLVTDPQEIKYVLENLGIITPGEPVSAFPDLDVRALLVGTAERRPGWACGDYTQVWACERSVPLTTSRWYDLLD